MSLPQSQRFNIAKQTMSDSQKLELCEQKINMATINLFSKKITKEEFAKIFDKYLPYVTHYRRKLNQPDLFASTTDDPDELLKIVDLQG